MDAPEETGGGPPALLVTFVTIGNEQGVYFTSE